MCFLKLIRSYNKKEFTSKWILFCIILWNLYLTNNLNFYYFFNLFMRSTNPILVNFISWIMVSLSDKWVELSGYSQYPIVSILSFGFLIASNIPVNKPVTVFVPDLIIISTNLRHFCIVFELLWNLIYPLSKGTAYMIVIYLTTIKLVHPTLSMKNILMIQCWIWYTFIYLPYGIEVPAFISVFHFHLIS